jgi:hypothetical protein
LSCFRSLTSFGVFLHIKRYDLLYNTNPAGDKLAFNPKDKSDAVKIPVAYVRSASAKKYFTNQEGAIRLQAQLSFTENIRRGYNVLGYIDNKSDKTIILGAHFDHLGYGEDNNSRHTGAAAIHNGADDNASGVSMMLTLARMLKKKQFQSSNYLFIAFSGEELGLLGSKYFVEHAPIDLKSVRYMINLDMVGRLNDSTQALTVGGFGTSPVWSTLIAPDEAGMRIKIDSAGAGPSDHTSFYRKNIPVLFFFTGVHSDYHKPSDDVEKINVPGMVRITRLIEKVISKSLSLPNIPFTLTRENTMGKASFKVSLGIMPDYAYDGEGVRVDGVSENKPAQKAGILAGDVVIKLDDISIKNINQYMQALGRYKRGDNITVTVKRNEKSISLPVTF